MIPTVKAKLAKLNADAIFTVSIVVARIQMGLMVVAESLSFLSSDPNFQSGINTLIPPTYIPWIFISLGLITELAHARRRHNAADPSNSYNDSDTPAR